MQQEAPNVGFAHQSLTTMNVFQLSDIDYITICAEIKFKTHFFVKFVI